MTTDDEIKATQGDTILNELKSMFTDRNLVDSVEWDSLNDADIRDMARIERDGMLQYLPLVASDKPKENKPSHDNKDVDPNVKHLF